MQIERDIINQFKAWKEHQRQQSLCLSQEIRSQLSHEVFDAESTVQWRTAQ